MSGNGEVKVRAAVSRGVGMATSIKELLLAAPGADEVRVAIDACAVCHSDLMFLDGGWSIDFPVVLGHEAAGRVVELGEGVDNVAAGDRVVVSLIRACGNCRACQRGHDVACTGDLALLHRSPLSDLDGEPVTHGLGTAAFAEQVVVHCSQVAAFPDTVPPEAAALLGCGVLTGVGAVTNTAQVGAEDAVVVIGCGGVGLSVIQGARLAGADPIIAVDPLPTKQEAALGFGATHATGPDGIAELLTKATGGRLADHVFVTTAAPGAFAGAADQLDRMGSLVLVGIPAEGVKINIDPGLLAVANQRILGSKMGTARLAEDVPRLVDQYLAGLLDLDSMVTSTHSLDDIDTAFAEARSGEAIRTVVVFDHSGHTGDSTR
ncbi:MAG TPA: alcohol dehydrogenase catalytic domain-containing protein [Acidimicrobiales bacterium]|jgi:Zn-dependent alcohol dehydrogenase|nr:zinc-binding dehydrogenase [Actinomycetota bacterium]MDP6062919.1 alcohol dehydrogenase catalytic domain-containing protein [Acidimicrobiales bacterium]MDP7208983.1 alcohol dehydrogenase catalytic domain-containing protein [Acidimicrobiales bacterium]HJL89241.1 alcohol dehydrogenase catalytic domain-containing protein [Acidimicrobiales bacterium]HJO99318.1 alcohol dehydrogenase catalytic domain-containing protein [Acidimicrobiales bacterium]|tara:strand:+ start:16369 stop:17499 length:1131 start_codon:yes stop_codon:yes gene_type:complete